MEIDYELSQGEYEYLTRRSFKERQAKILVPVLLVGSLAIFLMSYPRDGLISALIAALPLVILYALFIPIFIRYVARATYRSLKQSPSWGETKVRLEPDALTSATYLIKSEIRWEAVTRIAEDPQGFYLYLNPIQVVMVPRRVFGSVEEANAFGALATEYYQHAKKATTAAERVRVGR